MYAPEVSNGLIQGTPLLALLQVGILAAILLSGLVGLCRKRLPSLWSHVKLLLGGHQ